ncbi:MAG: hypothetical protein ACD_17C00240G0003 [uncultured bacterium]|nr:MAG: hypothetical protein ACD_17C00240G0003 [uncultured bacterium]
MSSGEARLVFVINTFEPDFGSVSFFIQRGDPSKRIGPFVGLRDQQRLSPLLPPEDRALIDLILALGLSDGRSIDNRFRYVSEISETISRHKHLFVRSQRHGSVRKASAKDRSTISSLLIRDSVAPLGVILRGVLEVAEDWNVRLLWKYAELDSPIPFLALPDGSEAIKTYGGRFIRRNSEAEIRLLQELSRVLEVSFDRVQRGNLEDVVLSRLTMLPTERWEVTYRSKTVLPKEAYFDSSGIAWFETDEEGSKQPLDFELVAEAYLKGRGRMEVNGKLIFFPVTSAQGLTDEIALKITTTSASNVPVAAITRVEKTFSESKRVALQKQLAKAGFQTELRNYQLDGVLWLSSIYDLGVGGVLADEMGLGKTVQTLAFITSKGIQRSLIVAPASVIPNWKAETEKFAPGMACIADGRLSEAAGGIFILSYQRALRLQKEIAEAHFDLIVLDEGQFVKNVQTKTAIALRRSTSRLRIVLTGTPIENSVDDLWAHLTFTNESLLGPYKKLTRKFKNFSKSAAAADLTTRAFNPLILRRTKLDVELDLPPMVERVVYCEMGRNQRRVYDTTLGAFRAMLTKGVAARVSSLALEALLRLRQCCSFPLLLPIALNQHSVRESSKLDAALEIIDGDVRNRRKTIVFSQFRKVSDAIQESLESRHIGSVRLDGETVDRETPVKRFQTDPSVQVFVIGFRSGGFGLNLTAAESVVLFDPWWNPAAESQAFARAHRIGQKKAVLVSKLICSDSIEEKMLKLIAEKSLLANSLSDLSEQMTTDELIKLIVK